MTPTARADPARPARALAALLAALLLAIAGCAAGDRETARATDPAPAATGPPAFQRHLDRLGVDYRVPAEGKAILVNIPAFEVIAFRDGVPELRSRVIVGTPWHPTPRIETHTSAVRFRPRWRPTPSMIASGEYRDRIWPPGENNPLGLAAIRLEPGLLVYLHDTNRRELFEREARALSHGCIRVQRWDELVAWVLGRDLAEVHRLAHGNRTLDVPTEAIPVTLGYFTVFPDDAGTPMRYENVYDLPEEGAARQPDGAGCVSLGD